MRVCFTRCQISRRCDGRFPLLAANRYGDHILLDDFTRIEAHCHKIEFLIGDCHVDRY
jgi:hypothetical protein